MNKLQTAKVMHAARNAYLQSIQFVFRGRHGGFRFRKEDDDAKRLELPV